jgi:hypothetical protein
MVQTKTQKEVIKSNLAYVELNGMAISSLKLNGHTMFKKKPRAK